MKKLALFGSVLALAAVLVAGCGKKEATPESTAAGLKKAAEQTATDAAKTVDKAATDASKATDKAAADAKKKLAE